MFSCLSNGTVKNLYVETAQNHSVNGSNNIGILLGKATNVSLDNCHVTGTVLDGTNIGGIVGVMDDGLMSKCHSSVSITTQNKDAIVGGLVGSSSGGQIEQSSSNINMIAQGDNTFIGGLVGEMTSGEIIKCYSTGTLTAAGSQSYAGGLVGSNAATITDCYSDAAITSSYNAAGLVAYNYGLVEKCHASGNLFSNNYAAGVIGYNDGENAVVKNCAAVNNKIEVTYEPQQTQQTGGYGQRIIGGIKNNAPAPEMNNYALKTMQVSVNDVTQKIYDDILNGTAKTEGELRTAATYQTLGWDFSSIWGIDEGQTYPYLLWEVDANPVADITLDKTSLLIAMGKTETINASIMPLGATNKRLDWTTSDANVATVEDGVVTAVGVGSAIITAAATDGSGVTATCQVTVIENMDVAIAELLALVEEAQTLYDNSTEGDDIGQYAPGSRAALLAVINSVRSQISSTMDEETISDCIEQLNNAIALFESQRVTPGEDTDYSVIDNTLYIERVEASAGGQVALSIKMKNTVEIQGYQFDLYLPEGVTVATDEDGFIMAELSTERTTARKTDYFNSTMQNNGSLRILCGSSTGYTFNGSDGEVAIVTVNISADIQEDDHPIILKNVVLTEPDMTKHTTDYLKSTLAVSSYMLGDVNADGSVDVADFIGVANHILGNTPDGFVYKAADINVDNSIDVADFIGVANIILRGTTSANQSHIMMAPRRVDSVTPTDIDALDNAIYIDPVTAEPGTQQVLSVKMKNVDEVAGFEFSLKLPEGITVATDEDGLLMAELSTERTTNRKTDYFNSDIQADGTLKVLCGSSTMNPQTGKVYTFSGNDGEVARITIDIPSDYEAGEYAVHVLNGILADADSHKTELETDITSLLTIEANDGRIHFSETDTSLPSYNAGDKADVAMVRTINADEWSTIVLPFTLTKAKAEAIFGSNMQLAEFDGFETEYDENDEDDVTPDAITLKFTTYTMNARTKPMVGGNLYLIKLNSEDIMTLYRDDHIQSFTADDVTLTKTVNEVETYDQWGTYGKFTGTFVKTKVPADGLFLSGNKFWYSTGKTNIKAFRGWFELGAVLNEETDFGANLNFVIDGDPTSINGISGNLMKRKGDVYTIQGQYVGHNVDMKRLPSGIYIIDGKKMVIK